MKAIPISLAIMALLPMVLAFNPQVEIGGIQYTPSPFENVFGPYSTGSQVSSTVKVSDSSIDEWKRIQLEWGSDSYVGCSRDSVSSNSIDYTCILTVTPFMQGNTDVNLVVYPKDDSLSPFSVLWGTFDFKGQELTIQPSQPSTAKSCQVIEECKRYRKECSYEQVCVKYGGYKKVCAEYQGSRCKKYQRVKVDDSTCTKYRKKRICSYTDECISWRKKKVCD